MRLSGRALNRALLARQGLLERLAPSPVRVVESIGALQAQYWPALPVALWSRVHGFAAADLYDALEAGDLVVGTLIRRTLHLVSAAEHPSYSMVTEVGGFNEWRRTSAEPARQAKALRSSVLRYLKRTRTPDEICAFIEEWLSAHPGAIDEAELAVQRKYKWRAFYTWSALLRVPADGRWSAKAPTAFRAAPYPPGSSGAPAADRALADVVRCHLRAFGPATAEDVATWIGWRTPPVREALERLAPGLERFTDEAKRTLYDLPDGLRPDPDTEAPVRFLPAFDSTLLAYARDRRQRILPDEHKEAVYTRANLRLHPTFLVDGMVAGLWGIDVKRRAATLTLRPFARPSRATQAALEEEAERLVRFSQPAASTHRVTIEG